MSVCLASAAGLWHKGLKVWCIVFEGRDSAGKGGTIKAISPNAFSPALFCVTPSAPTERSSRR